MNESSNHATAKKKAKKRRKGKNAGKNSGVAPDYNGECSTGMPKVILCVVLF